jgi:ABC-2 type transport system ATP-binding protein
MGGGGAVVAPPANLPDRDPGAAGGAEAGVAADRPAYQAVVRIDGLRKLFPVRRRLRETILHPRSGERTVVLDSVSLAVQRGEFFGLLGPNGAGKTTLFKVLSTLVLPDAGRVTVEGLDVERQGAAVRRVLTPVITDERSLFWRVSARENLRFYGALNGLRKGTLLSRVDELLHVVGLHDAGDKMVGKFSSGMKQKLLIARALIARPKVLLLDEPTRSLDPLSARAFRMFLREEIVGKQGCTVLLATHSAEEAFELCDRLAVLDHGRLLATGTPDELGRRGAAERYRLWTRNPDHPAFSLLARRGAVGILKREPADVGGWAILEVEVPGGADAVAEANRILAENGVAIARLERVRLSLPDLIERVIQDGRAGEPDA